MSQYLFGCWQFNSDKGELSNGQNIVHLEPQVAKLLDYFLVHQNILTSRDELINAVWGGRLVSDDAINRCVSILRQALTPDNKGAFIETVVRGGFISHFPAAPIKTIKSQKRSRRKLIAIVLGVILFVVMVLNLLANQ